MKHICPECKEQFAEKGSFFPFCSERCKLLDLGAWASESYVVPGPSIATDEIPQHEIDSEGQD